MSMFQSLEDLRPVLSDLAGIPQDPFYHGEGDVLTHTRLVMEEMEKLPSFLALSKDEQDDMLVAAALHDLGKKVCTRLEDGRWKAPNHSDTGAKMARELLMGRFGLCGTPESLRRREAVCALIRWHMKPQHIFEARSPGRVVRQMAAAGELTDSFTLEKLAILAEADSRGRICADLPGQLEAIDLFRMLAEDEGCFRRPFPYMDPCTRYADLSGKSYLPDQPVYDGTWGTVIMMSGLPGTGKDTYAAQHFAGLPMLSLDDLRREMDVSPGEDEGAVAQKGRERARSFLRKMQPFVFNATNLSGMIRSKWISLFHQYGAAVKIIYLETGRTERERRNLSRRDCVPEAAVGRMLRNLTPPALTEAEEICWVCI